MRSLERDYLTILDSLARGDLAAARLLADEWRKRGMPSSVTSPVSTRLAFYDHDRTSYGNASATLEGDGILSSELSHLLSERGNYLLKHSPPALDMVSSVLGSLSLSLSLSLHEKMHQCIDCHCDGCINATVMDASMY